LQKSEEGSIILHNGRLLKHGKRVSERSCSDAGTVKGGKAVVADGRRRVVIERVKPEIDGGRFAIKRTTGQSVTVFADIIADGHESVRARLLYRHETDGAWTQKAMAPRENDVWEGEFPVGKLGSYLYTVEAWTDGFMTWQKDLRIKAAAGQVTGTDLLAGAELVAEAAKRAVGEDELALSSFRDKLQGTPIKEAVAVALGPRLETLIAQYPSIELATRYERDLFVVAERPKALFSAWYEFFPRSMSLIPGTHGTIADCERLLPEIARMGFDVLYLPPVHPIGATNRKGKNNSLDVSPSDVGSPWAIGSPEGGHTAVHPNLGSEEDLLRFISKAKEHSLEIALDLAFQCSPDHPYVREHPAWFRWRADGTVQFAENPPKKYEDIIPFNFETENWKALWEELKGVVLYWIEKGVRIFRVDNPHTKPFAFWEWLISEIRRDFPDVIFLAEAFTRPKVVYGLGKRGFSQSYTYFTWRNTKQELTEYLTELTISDAREYLRPNFWPNTPDILSEYLQYGGRPAFIARIVLAATLSSNYGIYGPPFELCVTDALSGREEYLNSEKYEIRQWDWDQPGNLKDLIARLNRIRRENTALQTTWNLTFLEVDNDSLLFYAKTAENLSNIILVIVNLDPYHTQSGWVRVPIQDLSVDSQQPYLVHDLLSDDKYVWHGERNYVELDPRVLPASILRLKKRLKRESDFDYYV
jgi:starch synthase (maltosyl-transferring)